MATAASAPAVTDVARERDVYGLSGDVKKDLMDYLDNIASSGDFATMKSMPNLSVDPDVRILGKGDQEDCKIEAPLGLQDAQKLINAARQAPFGKGEKTIVDTTFRNTWELDPSQFSLSKNWQLYVDSLMRSACDGLGVKTNDVRAELYKMLLYEKGAMFKPHADSEKTSGMFGTFVISSDAQKTIHLRSRSCRENRRNARIPPEARAEHTRAEVGRTQTKCISCL